MLFAARRAFLLLKSDLTPNQIAAGVFFGVVLGMTPLGLHSLALFLLALLFDTSLSALLFAFAPARLAYLLVAPLAFRTGTMLLDGGCPPAEWLLSLLVQAPFTAWMGFERYLLFGSYALALPTAAGGAVLARRLVSSYRAVFAGRMAESALYRKAMSNMLVRAIHRVVAGPEKAEFVERKSRFFLLRPFRPWMLVAVPSLAVAVTIGAGFYAQWMIGDIAAGAVGRALGVRCTFGEIRYSFFSQDLSCRDFQLPDPSVPKENLVQVGVFETDLSFWDLMCRRVRFERLSARDIALHVARKEDGSLNVNAVKPLQPAEKTSAGEKKAWDDYLGWIRDHADDLDWAALWKRYQEYRESADREAAAAPEPPPPPYDPQAKRVVKRSRPLFRVDQAEITGLRVAVDDRSKGGRKLPAITAIEARLTDVSSDPGWNGNPMVLAGSGKLEDGKSGELHFRIEACGEGTGWFVRVASVPLAEIRSLYEKSLPVRVEGGSVTLNTAGKLTSKSLDAAQNVQIDGLKIAAKPDRPRILGLDEETSKYALQGINAYGEKLPVVVGIAITGRPAAPEVHADLPFLEIAKKGLEMLGRKELQKYIDRIGGTADAIVQTGLAQTVPLQDDFQKTQESAAKALETGDFRGLQETAEKTREDLKNVRDTKNLKEKLKEEIDPLKDVFDLFGRKKKKKDKEPAKEEPR